MKLFHVTTPKKAKLYGFSKRIIAPVRGFTTLMGAMFWAMQTGRTVIYEFEADKPHKLPDHHNKFGEAWWNDGDVKDFKCVLSSHRALNKGDLTE